MIRRVNCFHFYQSLINFLSILSILKISGALNGKTVAATGNEVVVSSYDIYLNDIMPCNIEEADECFLLHTLDILKSFDIFLIKTVDGDAVIIATAATSIFAKLSKVTAPAEIAQEDYKLIEKFFIVLYSTTTNSYDINSARRMLLTHQVRSIGSIPPTLEALKQHILGATMQASMWNDCLKKQRSYPNPTEWGWQKFMSCFGAIYQMRKRIAGNLPNAVPRNHAKADAAVASKNYSVQSYVPVQDSAKLFQNKHLHLTETFSKIATKD